MTVEAAPTPHPWIPLSERGSKLKATAGSTTHSYTTDDRVLASAGWVYLQIVFKAYQIHPATVDELDVLGPVGGRNALRWTIEGPTSHRPGDPGAGANCAMKLEVAYSTTATPGSDWQVYRPRGRYKLRSFKTRLTITRPDETYDFRVVRFATRATRVGLSQRDHYTERFLSDLVG